MTYGDHTCERYDIGVEEALSITLGALKRVSPVELPVEEACDLIAAQDLFAIVDCPSATSSLKDGFAVVSKDIEKASEAHPVRLKVTGTSAAGDNADKSIESGLAIKVLTGARLPRGADAVIAVEFTRECDNHVLCHKNALPGRNVLFRGTDVKSGESVVLKGEILTPALTGLLAAGGVHRVKVFPMSRVGIVATGDEVVAPGRVLESGQVYASNLVTLHSWVRHFRMEGKTAVVRDHRDAIREALSAMLSWADVILTSGGAWKSERDLTVRVLDEMGWRLMFHRVRIGPGKAVALGMIDDKPLFCLPGGPPSNEMAFLQIALPGILQMGGKAPMPFQIRKVRLTETIGGDRNWTQFFQATLEEQDKEWWVVPQQLKSRLQSQARTEALIKVPEGVDRLEAGDMIQVQVLREWIT